MSGIGSKFSPAGFSLKTLSPEHKSASAEKDKSVTPRPVDVAGSQQAFKNIAALGSFSPRGLWGTKAVETEPAAHTIVTDAGINHLLNDLGIENPGNREIEKFSDMETLDASAILMRMITDLTKNKISKN